MTNEDVAELRGELLGLKVLVVNCLSFIAAHTDDPKGHLAAIQDHAIAGIAETENSKVRRQYLPTFRAAAAGIVVQAIETVVQASDPTLRSRSLQ